MKKTKMTTEKGRETVRQIGGGRPLRRRKKTLRIPIGLEKTLCLAAADDGFRDRLLSDRTDAVSAAGFHLSSAEGRILRSMPDGVLSSMISGIDLGRHTRRGFMRNVLACAVAGSAASTIVACEEAKPAGIDPWQEDILDEEVSAGDVEAERDAESEAEPDTGQADVIETDSPPIDGSMPDVPEEVDTIEVDEPEIAPMGILPDEEEW